ncbi:protein FAR-RED ELONGATED HYPOCOTYL 3-like [Sesbania bispinosa]|nr:protein FAR-RED ELONGATED HYPOCOTYL 3-like [Sesbania bispinosa]
MKILVLVVMMKNALRMKVVMVKMMKKACRVKVVMVKVKKTHQVGKKMLLIEEFVKYHFSDLEVAFKFYNWKENISTHHVFGSQEKYLDVDVKPSARFRGMFPSHRKMDSDEIRQVNEMRDAGISTPNIYQEFAGDSGGFEGVGFNTCDM